MNGNPFVIVWFVCMCRDTRLMRGWSAVRPCIPKGKRRHTILCLSLMWLNKLIIFRIKTNGWLFDSSRAGNFISLIQMIISKFIGYFRLNKSWTMNILWIQSNYFDWNANGCFCLSLCAFGFWCAAFRTRTQNHSRFFFFLFRLLKPFEWNRNIIKALKTMNYTKKNQMKQPWNVSENHLISYWFWNEMDLTFRPHTKKKRREVWIKKNKK